MNPQAPGNSEGTPDTQQDNPQVVMPQWTYQSGQLQQVQPISEQPPAPAPAPPSQPAATDQQPPQPTVSQMSPTFDEPEQLEEPLAAWTASEFVAHEKQRSWYLALGGATALLAIVLFVIVRDFMTVVLVVVLGVAFGVFGATKPRELDYALYEDGLQVGNKHYSYIDFRSFSVLDGGLPSLQLLPQKRFMVPITLYVEPQQIDQIVDIIGQYLPNEQRDRDWVDRFTTKIRF